MAADVADHAVADANDVAADRLTEDLAVERRHAFNVAGRDAEDLADGVQGAVRHPATFLLDDLQGFDRRRARVFVVMQLVLDGRALGFTQGETVCLDKRAVHA
ncbi:hypothetical protein D3C84_834160 [compost metagenome]